MARERDTICEQFGRNLRRMRSLAGLTQAELGEHLGVTHQQIQKYEAGRDNVSVAALCRLRAILGCEYSDLLKDLDGGTMAGSVLIAGRERLAYRVERAVLAIADADLQERLAGLVEALAAHVGKERD
jgi:transcriptional regulator with XRE-family HTH domain